MIGRSKDCDIQLADPNVSRRHAELRQEGSAYWLDRPRLDERLAGERPPHGPGEARQRRHDHDRLDRPRLRAEARSSDRVDSLAVGEALLILKILFLLLLYLFIWRIVRTASRDLRLPQESFVLDAEPGAGGRPARRATARSRPAGSSSPTAGSARPRLAHGLTIGRERRERHRARRRLRLGAPRADRAEARRRLGRGRRLDERHVRERREARRSRGGSRPAT